MSRAALPERTTTSSMPPGRRRAPERSQAEASAASRRRSMLGTPCQIAEKPIDAAVAEGVHGEIAQGFGREADDVSSSCDAVRKLRGREWRCGHHIALLTSGIEDVLYLSQGLR